MQSQKNWTNSMYYIRRKMHVITITNLMLVFRSRIEKTKCNDFTLSKLSKPNADPTPNQGCVSLFNSNPGHLRYNL